jgi:biopolymer transport protein ExbD
VGAKLSGGGGGKYEIAQNADINVTPFVDIMLVLLIIFMVSIPVATVSIKLDLPPATPPQNLTEKPKEPTFVSIEEDGTIYIGDQASTLDTLAADLVSKIGGDAPTEERIFVRAHQEVRYENFMEVMNQLQDNGFYEIGLISEDIS